MENMYKFNLFMHSAHGARHTTVILAVIHYIVDPSRFSMLLMPEARVGNDKCQIHMCYVRPYSVGANRVHIVHTKSMHMMTTHSQQHQPAEIFSRMQFNSLAFIGTPKN